MEATDRIQKTTVLRAPRSRVWRAISDPGELGSWFGMKMEGPLEPGRTVACTIVPTTVDPEVAAQQRAHEGGRFEVAIARVEPERLVSFRWHPYAAAGDVDYHQEPTTLVSFELEEAGDDVKLTVTESGFEALPEPRRRDARAANDHGWAKQMELVEKYVAGA